ncbi:MAG TPA: type II toxin-antitoxin system PemK/MazF family toxin [Blastocatellia bacterium]|nr:type II toxin-antitoxin system PemK/MazF family toxin [Blastocatellia bacterium]
MRQGDIYWYTFRAPDKRHPVLIITRNSAISFLTGITVAPLTIRIRDIPTEVVLTPEEDSVATECAVNLDNIQTIQKANLEEFLTTLSPERMREVRAATEFALGFDALR